MSAQPARLLISLVGLVLAAVTWFALAPGWMAWISAALILVASGIGAEATFRRLASAETIRADLQDRVRNPPP
jgi:hypothetical protein